MLRLPILEAGVCCDTNGGNEHATPTDADNHVGLASAVRTDVIRTTQHGRPRMTELPVFGFALSCCGRRGCRVRPQETIYLSIHYLSYRGTYSVPSASP